MEKTYKIVVYTTVNGVPELVAIERSDDKDLFFLSYQKAEAFSHFLDGLGYTREY